jgi:hypothetical protein
LYVPAFSGQIETPSEKLQPLTGIVIRRKHWLSNSIKRVMPAASWKLPWERATRL